MADATINVTYGGSADVSGDVEIAGLDNIKTDNTSTLTLATAAPLQSRAEVAVTEPVVVDTSSSMELSIKPLVSDVCARLELGALPPTVICQPYTGRIGFTLFGVEIFGFRASAEATTIVNERRQPYVVPAAGSHEVHDPRAVVAGGKAPTGDAGGLRIRLGG